MLPGVTASSFLLSVADFFFLLVGGVMKEVVRVETATIVDCGSSATY